MCINRYRCSSASPHTFCQSVQIPRPIKIVAHPAGLLKKCHTVKSINTYCQHIKTWGVAGVKPRLPRNISPRTILSKFKTYFFLNILLRCCLCNSTFIWAKVRSGQRWSFSANLNLLYHLLFLILPHNDSLVMVIQYVGAIVLV